MEIQLHINGLCVAARNVCKFQLLHLLISAWCYPFSLSSRYLIIVLICISLLINNVELSFHLLIRYLFKWLSLKSLLFLNIGLSVFFVLIYGSSLCFLDVSLLLGIDRQISSSNLWLTFSFSCCILINKLWILIKSNLFIFYDWCFIVSFSRNLYLLQNHEDKVRHREVNWFALRLWQTVNCL